MEHNGILVMGLVDSSESINSDKKWGGGGAKNIYEELKALQNRVVIFQLSFENSQEPIKEAFEQ